MYRYLLLENIILVATLVTNLPYFRIPIFAIQKLVLLCIKFDSEWTRYIEILFHLQRRTGSSQMNPFHTLERAGQGRLEKIKIERGPEQRGSDIYFHLLPKLLTVRADFSYSFVPR